MRTLSRQECEAQIKQLEDEIDYLEKCLQIHSQQIFDIDHYGTVRSFPGRPYGVGMSFNDRSELNHLIACKKGELQNLQRNLQILSTDAGFNFERWHKVKDAIAEKRRELNWHIDNSDHINIHSSKFQELMDEIDGLERLLRIIEDKKPADKKDL